MSYTEICGFDKKGNAYLQASVRNSWRGAMAIWNILGKRYLSAYYQTDANTIKEVWDLFNSDNISDIDRIVLGTTYDKVIVKKEKFSELIKAFKNFEGETSLKEQAEILKIMADDENCIAVAWNQTSVNDNTWANFDYDDEAGESIAYNMFENGDHWYLFDEIQDTKSAG